MTRLVLPDALRAQIAREALAASPSECCGLIEGTRHDDRFVVTALHPARNISVDADRFEIDPADHFRALHAARSRGSEILGCYHSHPEGRAEPSPRDRDGAAETGFVWLIAAPRVANRAMLAAYVFDGADFSPLEMEAPGSLDPPAASTV
ncbi:MAG TPA: M67 family metallopeptidase [Rhizomicrobium sp.]|nr:M67 family metallopeptidase [Rhizomicrobium sp.]